MKSKNRSVQVKSVGVFIVLLTMACALTSNIEPTATPKPPSSHSPSQTPTPTIIAGGELEGTESPPQSRCDGLSGELEMQILGGPAEAAELEPLAVGSIPFTVVAEGNGYVVQGGGAISYQETLEKNGVPIPSAWKWMVQFLVSAQAVAEMGI
jgi:hypothetical protein